MSEPPLFGSLLKRHRLDRGLTHEALAERATLSVRAISDLERGVSTSPRHDTVMLLAAALNLSPPQREGFLRAAGRGRPWEKAAHPNLAASGIPLPLTSFIGRERELAMLRQLLLRSGARLVTITGPGGVGKTRLAIQAAMTLMQLFEDGVRYVSLTAATDHESILRAIIRALELPEHSAEPPAAVVDQLRNRQLLLLLDNFEHLIDAAPLVTELLRNCPQLVVLITSREVLRLSGEHEVSLDPLPIVDVMHLPPLSDMARVPSVALLVARAIASRPDFRLDDDNALAIASLCKRLDGLPLALELAAARLKLLTPDALLARLDSDLPGGSLHLLFGGARDWPSRHRSLRETIAWSYDLLTRDEQWLLRQLSVFQGGCTIEAAEAVCGAVLSSVSVFEAVASLQDKSLIQHAVGPDGRPRAYMLETIRQFALEKLESHGEESEARQRHAQYYLSQVESMGGLLFASAPQRQRGSAERDNVEDALKWFVRHG
jgi:predicted ATPase